MVRFGGTKLGILTLFTEIKDRQTNRQKGKQLKHRLTKFRRLVEVRLAARQSERLTG